MKRRDIIAGFGAACSIAAAGRAAAEGTTVRIDHDFPGGNIALDEIRGDDVFLHQELRDTRGDWFYWYFRVRGAPGRQLRFHFTKSRAIGVLGPGISIDEGRTWRWLGAKSSEQGVRSQYHFGPKEESVRFSFGMPYQEADLKRFLAEHRDSPYLKAAVLTKSRKGREVERIHAGCIAMEPRFRVLVTCRYHACEMMTNYVAEGMLESILGDSDDGAWLRKNVELLLIPFVDKDGVEDGDQGKNRIPVDHKADREGIYPETAALKRFVPEWRNGQPLVDLDLHDPTLGGQVIYTHSFRRNDENSKRGAEFLGILEAVQQGPLRFRVQDSIDFGAKMKAADEQRFAAEPKSGVRRSAVEPGPSCSIGFEFPYAMVQGVEVNPASARAFGHDLAAALHQYLRRAAG